MGEALLVAETLRKPKSFLHYFMCDFLHNENNEVRLAHLFCLLAGGYGANNDVTNQPFIDGFMLTSS